MDTIPWMELTILLAVLAAYVIVLRGMTNRAYSSRLRLYALGQELLADKDCDDTDRMMVRHCLDVAMTFRGALWWLVISIAVFVRIVLEPIFGRPNQTVHPNVSGRMIEFAELFFKSVIAANPIIGMLALAVSWIGVFLDDVKGPHRSEEYAEKKVDMAFETARLAA